MCPLASRVAGDQFNALAGHDIDGMDLLLHRFGEIVDERRALRGRGLFLDTRLGSLSGVRSKFLEP